METAFEAVADADELKPGQMKKIQVGGKCLLLANADGELYAIDEMCSHEDYSLSIGCIQEGKIECSLHGSYFDLKTGQATVEPAHEPISTYALKVIDGKVWVDPAG